MTDADLERIAANNGDMPDNLTMPEIMMFQAMRHLYAVYRIGKIDRPKASAEKQKIMRQYADVVQMQRVYEYHRRIEHDLSRISQEITHGGCDCCKAVQDALGGIYGKHGST